MTKVLNGIVLNDYLHALLGNADWANCPLYIAEKIKAVDHDQQYTFVELPNELNKLEYPKVWRIEEWNKDYQRLLRRRKLSELENAAYFTYSDIRNKVLAHLVELTGLEAKDLMDNAITIAKTKNVIALKNFGVKESKLAELLAAEKELNEYKTKIGL